jgi:hypothetical protein
MFLNFLQISWQGHFQLQFPGSGAPSAPHILQPCGWVCKPISVLSLEQAEQYVIVTGLYKWGKGTSLFVDWF